MILDGGPSGRTRRYRIVVELPAGAARPENPAQLAALLHAWTRSRLVEVVEVEQ